MLEAEKRFGSLNLTAEKGMYAREMGRPAGWLASVVADVVQSKLSNYTREARLVP